MHSATKSWPDVKHNETPHSPNDGAIKGHWRNNAGVIVLRIIMVVMIFLALMVAYSHAATVNKVLGAGADATGSPAIIPLAFSKLCDGSAGNLNCPQFFHPDWTSDGSRFYGITNRVNPPIFVRSTDGGSVFTTVTTQPFVAAVLNFGSSMAVASDGSLLVASGQGANLCIIRKSTDGGVSWATRFTSLVENCSIGFGSPTPPGMYCASSGGYCAFVNPFNAATITVIYSVDDGENWTIGTAYSQASGDSRTWGPILGSGGSPGIIVRGINSTVGQPFGTQLGGDFIATPNFVPPANVNCRPLIQGTATRAICGLNGGGSTYRLVDGTIPSILSTFTAADTGPSYNESLVVGFNSSVGYMFTVSSATTTRLNMYVTLDTWSSVVLAAQVTPATSPVAGCCKGNIFVWNGNVYFSSGASGAGAFLMKVSR